MNKLDKEIKKIVKAKTDKDASRKEVDEAIKRLEKEILQLKKSEHKTDSAG